MADAPWVLASLLVPGLGQGLATHRVRMIAWAAAVLVCTVLVVVSVWFFAAAIVLRVAGAVDAYVCLRRAARPYHRVNAAIAVVVAAVGLGYVRLAVHGYKIPSSSMYPTLVIGDHVFVDTLSPRWRAPERGEVIVFTHPCGPRTYIKRVIARGGDTVEVRCSIVYLNGVALPSPLVDASASYKDLDDRDGEWSTREVSRYRETLGAHTYETFHDVDSAPGKTPDDRGDFPHLDRPFGPSCGPNRPGQPVGALVPTKNDAAACESQLHLVVPSGALFVMGDNRNNANDSRYWGLVAESSVIGRVIGIWMSDGIEGGWGRFGAIE